MKICLINPGRYSFNQPPLGLGYIASFLRKHKGDDDIRIVDENAGDNVEKEILKFKPDIVGITSTTSQIIDAQKIANSIKQNLPSIPIILGGVHVSVVPEETAKLNCFDIGVVGEGEVTFLELIKTFDDDQKFEHDKLKKIDGIVFKDNNKIIKTEERRLIKNIDVIPFPARDLMKMDEYYLKPATVVRGFVRRGTQTMTSRGCPYNCIFCSSHVINKRIFRPHSPEYVLREIEELVEKYKVEMLFVFDDTFIVDKNRVETICKSIIERGLNEQLEWCAQLRANLIHETDRDMLKLMKDAGCVQVEFGLESGSERILKLLKGGSVTVEDNKRAINICKDLGFRVLGNFMIGTPTETEEDIKKTKQFIIDNQKALDNIPVFITTPYPGTKLWNMCKERGMLKDIDWSNLWMGSSWGRGKECFTDTISESLLKRYHEELKMLGYKQVPLTTKIKVSLKDWETFKRTVNRIGPYALLKLKSLISK